MNPEPMAMNDLPCDVSRKFVRVLQRRANGFAECEFSIGWPDLAVELMLPQPAFEAFCQTHQVRWLDEGAESPASTTV